MIENLQYVSIIIEIAVAILGLLIVFQKKKNYGYFLSLTFAIYVFYDLSKQIGLRIDSGLLYALFFAASVSAIVFVWMIYTDKKK